MSNRTYNPDKAFLRRVCKKASSKREAASLCGFSEGTLTRRLREFGLDKELKILREKGIKARTDVAHRKKVAGQKKTGTKRTKKTPESSPLLASIAEKQKKSSPISGKELLDRVEEDAVLSQEIADAAKEVYTSSREEDQNEFFSSLAEKLGRIDNQESSTATAPVAAANSTKRDKYLPMLLRIANLLLDECEKE